jgi:hypothetical protein
VVVGKTRGIRKKNSVPCIFAVRYKLSVVSKNSSDPHQLKIGHALIGPLWRTVKMSTGKSRRSTSIKDLLWDRRCSAAVIDFLRATEIGRRCRERGQEKDDPGGGDGNA